jgi:hypothetical protein
VTAYQAALPELVEQVIRDGIRGGELAPADPRLLSWHFVAMVEVTLTPYADTLFEDTESRVDYLLDLFLGGCAATQPGESQ